MISPINIPNYTSILRISAGRAKVAGKFSKVFVARSNISSSIYETPLLSLLNTRSQNCERTAVHMWSVNIQNKNMNDKYTLLTIGWGYEAMEA